MRRLFAFVCAVVVLMSSCVVSYALDKAQFLIDVGTVKSNRLFDMSVITQYSGAISGGEFELTYDSSVVEYRGVSSECFEVKAKDYGDKLHIVFACADAVEVDNIAGVISVSFKSIAQGEFDAKLEVSECIDDKLQSIATQSSVSIITVDKSTVTATAKSNSDNKIAHKSSAKKSQMIKSDSNEPKLSRSIPATVNSLDTNKAIWYGVCAGLVVVISFALGMMFRKKADSNSDNYDEKE